MYVSDSLNIILDTDYVLVFVIFNGLDEQVNAAYKHVISELILPAKALQKLRRGFCR